MLCTLCKELENQEFVSKFGLKTNNKFLLLSLSMPENPMPPVLTLLLLPDEVFEPEDVFELEDDDALEIAREPPTIIPPIMTHPIAVHTADMMAYFLFRFRFSSQD